MSVDAGSSAAGVPLPRAAAPEPMPAVQMGETWQEQTASRPAPTAPRRRRPDTELTAASTPAPAPRPSSKSSGSGSVSAMAATNPGKLLHRALKPLFDAETYRAALYLLLSLPVGLFYVVMLSTLVSIGMALLPILVGVPILLGTLGLARLSGGFERWMVSTVLARGIKEPPRVARAGGFLAQIKMLATDSVTWRTLLWLLVRLPLGILGVTMVSLLVALPAMAILNPFISYWSYGELDFADLVQQLMVMVFVAPLVVGGAWVVRASGELLARLAAAFLGPSVQERAKKLEARTHVLEERTQLAHELHDSVGHAMTAVTLQAGAAEHVFDRDPEFARRALGDIRDRGERALGELDRILGQLSDDNTAARAPLPGLDRLSELVTETRRAGLPVGAVFNGDPTLVPDDVGRTVYRVVQEALTNVMKHAGQVETAVVVDITSFEVHVEVENQRRAQNGPTAFSGGRGLIGLRERVLAGGGTFNTGPTATGGYLVSARVPLKAQF